MRGRLHCPAIFSLGWDEFGQLRSTLVLETVMPRDVWARCASSDDRFDAIGDAVHLTCSSDVAVRKARFKDCRQGCPGSNVFA